MTDDGGDAFGHALPARANGRWREKTVGARGLDCCEAYDPAMALYYLRGNGS